MVYVIVFSDGKGLVIFGKSKRYCMVLLGGLISVRVGCRWYFIVESCCGCVVGIRFWGFCSFFSL